MSDPHSNDRDIPRCKQKVEREDPLTRSTRQFDNHFSSLFNTLWSLPFTIYQRGNEHGREFGRLMDERHQRHPQQEQESRGEREDEQEREDARGHRACGWRGRELWHHARNRRRREQENVGAEKATEPDKAQSDVPYEDWVMRVAQEVERNQQEAKRLYKEYEKKVLQADGQEDYTDREALQVFDGLLKKASVPSLGELTALFGDENPADKRATKAAAEENHSWADVFPAWSAARAPTDADSKDNEKKADSPTTYPETHHGPIVATAQQVEDAINQAHTELNALINGTSHIVRLMQESYNREARLWDAEGLFGAHMPFSRPLSTMFSLGMQPFMPEESAMGYLLFSEYSPLHLEHERGFDASFRRRFEDLVRVQSGREIREDGEGNEGTKVEWLGRINLLLESEAKGQEKGDWSAVWQVEKPEDASAQNNATDTEMDVYEQQLPARRIPGSVLPRAVEHPGDEEHESWHATTSSSSPMSASAMGGSGILSTLTTTQRHVAADGTITTKTVLKKQFSDGREETETSTTTEDARPVAAWARQRQLEHVARVREGEQESKIAKEAKRGGGWFWSS